MSFYFLSVLQNGSLLSIDIYLQFLPQLSYRCRHEHTAHFDISMRAIELIFCIANKNVNTSIFTITVNIAVNRKCFNPVPDNKKEEKVLKHRVLLIIEIKTNYCHKLVSEEREGEKMDDPLKPTSVPLEAETILWFEFLLNPSLLTTHLQKENASMYIDTSFIEFDGTFIHFSNVLL